MFAERRLLIALISICLAGACGGRTSHPPPLGVEQNDAGQDAPATDAGPGDAEPDAIPPPVLRPSCQSGAPGAGHDCGQDGAHDCCASSWVPGGTFNAFWDPGAFKKLRATVTGFKLDDFEVTVGRFRAFVDAYPASAPQPGAGANPHVPGSGWQAGWPLPATAAELRADVHSCILPSPTWTDEPGPNERRPINCVTWYELFAFCAWDHARLPTAVERNYAAVGGSEQRFYPWSAPPGSTAIDPADAVYSNDFQHPDYTLPEPVGSRPAGVGRWGQYDLGGNVGDWELDQVLPEFPCTDCAGLAAGTLARSYAGGGWDLGPDMAEAWYHAEESPELHYPNVGGRCVVVE